MEPKYSIGQEIKIKSAEGHTSLRDSAIDGYIGQIGEIVDYYWISPRGSEVFYIYSVRIGPGYKEIALHEDEIEPRISDRPLRTRVKEARRA